MALNAMIRHLLMGHVSGLFPRHVAAATVEHLRVMLADEGRLSVTGEAPASEVAYPLLGGGRTVRIMTRRAGKPVSTLSLTLALQQSFPLAGCSAVRTQLAGVNKVS